MGICVLGGQIGIAILVVNRARIFVAEFFTNSPGQYVRLDATIDGLSGIAEGDYVDAAAKVMDRSVR